MFPQKLHLPILAIYIFSSIAICISALVRFYFHLKYTHNKFFFILWEKIIVKNLNKGKTKYLFIYLFTTCLKSGVKTGSLKIWLLPPTKCSQIFQCWMPLGGLVSSSLSQAPPILLHYILHSFTHLTPYSSRYVSLPIPTLGV